MNFVKFLLITLLLVGLCGCVVAFKSINEESLGEVRPGMSTEEVVKIAGEPVEKENVIIDNKQCEVWRYPKERFFAKRYNPLGYLYYDILFEEGKVKEWFRAKVYSQPKYDLENPSAPLGTKEYKFFKGKYEESGVQPNKELKSSNVLPKKSGVSEIAKEPREEVVEVEVVEVGEALRDSLK